MAGTVAIGQSVATAGSAELAVLARAKSTKAFVRKADLVLREFEERDIGGGEIVVVHPMLEIRYAEQLRKLEQTKAAGIASGVARRSKTEEAAV